MKNKRLAIFAMYDRDGIADDYVLFFLGEIKKVANYLVVVCNGGLKEDQIPRLEQYADSVFPREDRGMDGTAYKEALEIYLTWDRVLEFDELILINDSCYGPFRPLTSIFEDMSCRECDFWCLTDMQSKASLAMPYHHEPYFEVIRRRLLHDAVFQEFWRSMREIRTYRDAVAFFEFRFTAFFQAHGFAGLAWCDTDKLHTSNRESEWKSTYVPIGSDPYRLISEFDLPVVKRKAFQTSQTDMLLYSMGEDPAKVLDYVEHNTSYDTGLIWKNLIRTLNPKQLKDSLNLNCIFSADNPAQKNVKTHKVVVVACLSDESALPVSFFYLRRIPSTVDLYIVAGTQKIKHKAEAIIKKEPILKAAVTLWEGGSAVEGQAAELFRNYEFACFVWDNEPLEFMSPETKNSRRNIVWEQLLYSAGYIENIISYFEAHPYVGLFAPPYHWKSLLKQELWEDSFPKVKALADKLELHCVLSQKFPPLTFGCSCWCRTKALEALTACDMPLSAIMADFATLGKLLPYVAQSSGYASGTVMNEEYAALRISDQLECLSQIIRNQSDKGSCSSSEPFLPVPSAVQQLYAVCEQVYVYGAGGVAARLLKALKDSELKVAGCIVSNGHKRMDQFYGCDIVELSDFNADRKTSGIILAIMKATDVVPELLSMGYKNICIAKRREE